MDLLEQPIASLLSLLGSLQEYVPHILAGLVFLVVGFGLAWVMSRVVPWIARKLRIDVFAEKVKLPKILYGLGIRSGVDLLLGKAAFWLVILGMVHIASSILGIPGPAQAINAFIAFLPQLAAALAIAFGGYLAAEAAQRVVLQAAEKLPSLGSPQLLARAVYVLILTLAVSISASQVGLEVDLIHAVILLCIAALCLGLAIAFGLGARNTFQNLIARFYAQRFYRIGDLIHWGDDVGTVVAFSPTSVILRIKDAELVIPCTDLMDQPVRVQRVAASSIPENPLDGVDEQK